MKERQKQRKKGGKKRVQGEGAVVFGQQPPGLTVNSSPGESPLGRLRSLKLGAGPETGANTHTNGTVLCLMQTIIFDAGPMTVLEHVTHGERERERERETSSKNGVK